MPDAVARILARIRRMERGNPGDARSVGKGVMEMRIDYGPGYRVYFVQRGADVVILLCGGDKRTQQRDIRAGAGLGGDMKMIKTTRFDVADYLDSDERQTAYIAAALETGDADFVRDALGLVARARGMGEIAKSAGLNRESLYKALGESGNPEFATIMRIVRALGLTLSARPAAQRKGKRRKVA